MLRPSFILSAVPLRSTRTVAGHVVARHVVARHVVAPHVAAFASMCALIGCSPTAPSTTPAQPAVTVVASTASTTSPEAASGASETDDIPEVRVSTANIHKSGNPAISVELPVLESEHRRMRNALAFISGEVRKMNESDIRDIEKWAASNGAGQNPFSLTTKCSVSLLSSSIVSVTCDSASYTGGVHGNHGTTGHTYALVAGKASPAKLSAMFSDPNTGPAAMRALILADLERQSAPDAVEHTIGDEVTDAAMAQFSMTQSAMVFHFAPYAVGAYVDGAYDVTLPFKSVGPLLHRTWQTLFEQLSNGELGLEVVPVGSPRPVEPPGRPAPPPHRTAPRG